ncbi:MAG: zinc-ribbon and DUF3426 domain-containing protein [Venatoribacter sp.]
MAVLALRCPHCKIRFSIKDTQIDAQGMIHCASCNQSFVAGEHSLEPEHKNDEFLIYDDMDEELIHDDMDESYLDSLEDDDVLIHDDMDTQPLQRHNDAIAEVKPEPAPEPSIKVEAPKKPLKTQISVPNTAKKAVATHQPPKAQAQKPQKPQPPQKAKEHSTESQTVAKTSLLDRYYDEQSQPKDQTQTWLWSGSIGLLVFLILFQTLYFNFHTWSRTNVRPVYEVICAVVRCTVPPIQDVNLMSTQHLVVRTHPKFKQALMIDTLIINNAEFEQPFPDLLLVFRDNKDWVVASRRFKPNKYLSGELAGETIMPAQIPIHISLEILDPGPQAVNYGVSLMANQ